jgi:hypothetical protein
VYVLTNKDDSVLLGPIQWSPGLILHTLQLEVGEDTTISPSDFKRVPYEPVEGYKIRFAEIVEEGFDPLFYDRTGPTWTFTEDKGIATYSFRQKDIKFIKQELKSSIATIRWHKENDTLNLQIGEENVSITASRESRSIYFQKYLLADEESSVPFKIDGRWLNFNKGHLKYIITKIDDHVQEVFEWERSLSVRIDESTSFDELVQIHQQIKEAVKRAE